MVGITSGCNLEFIANEAEMHPAVQQLGSVFAHYHGLRVAATDAERPTGAWLEEIRKTTGEWADKTGLAQFGTDLSVEERIKLCTEPDKDGARDRYGQIENFLRKTFPEIPEIDFATTEAYVASAFNKAPQLDDAGTLGAFVVSTRVTRGLHAGDHNYALDAARRNPMFGYMPTYLHPYGDYGLPSDILTPYADKDDRLLGFAIRTNVIPDQLMGLGNSDRGTLALGGLQPTIDFLQSTRGSFVAGLSGILPSLSFYGKKLKTPENILVTPGHEGTVAAMWQMVRKAIDDGLIENPKTFGTVGYGSIGQAATTVFLDRLPNSQALVYDNCKQPLPHDRLRVASSLAEVMMESIFTLCAVTEVIGYDEYPKDMRGKLIIDDSQPHRVDWSTVAARGGLPVQVIGTLPEGIYRAGGETFGDTVFNPLTDAFGCEAQTMLAAVHARGTSLDEARLYAAPRKATPESVNTYLELADQFTQAAPWQFLGRPSNFITHK